MRWLSRILLGIPALICVMLLGVGCASAQPGVPEPAVKNIDPASAEGSQILASATADLTGQLGKPAGLSVKAITTDGDWAFVYAKFQGVDGTPFDFAGTPFAEAAANGGKSRVYAGLFTTTDGGSQWTRVDSAVGPTDVAWSGWAEKYSAPADVFVTAH
jgi:hypothetical protein